MTTAGHTFDDGGKCSCGITRPQLRGVTRNAIGNPGWAHVGNLTENEYLELLQDQPPSVFHFVETSGRFYHDCDFTGELTEGNDKITVAGKTWSVIRCPRCDAQGRFRRPEPTT